MRKKQVIGNWKMHGSLAENQRLLAAIKLNLSELKGASLAVCVPFPYLAQTQASLIGSSLAWGAQNLSEHEKGAYTGEVSGSMLKDFGCQYVIVGHSERRKLYGETDKVVAAKYKRAQQFNLTPILCLGETLEEREQGITEKVVQSQLAAVIDHAGIASFKQAVIAYEPVWAIGTGKTATVEQAQAVHAFLRNELAKKDKHIADEVTLLYGGSVKASNALDLFLMSDIDGGLIGGASLIAEDFIAIAKAAAQTNSRFL